MFDARRFLVREQVKILATHQTYDIFDAETSQQIGVAEENLSSIVSLLRWFVSKHLMPTTVEVRDQCGMIQFTISRGWYIFRSRVEVNDPNGELVGYFKSKLISWGGGFYVYDRNDKQFAEVKGNIFRFNYKLVSADGSTELGFVSKKWENLAREFLTSADTYLVEAAEELQDQPFAKILVLSAALAIDLIFKSESRTGGESLVDDLMDI